MPSFNSLAGKKVTSEDLPLEYQAPVKQTNLLAKVFGVMFISLLATSLISYGFAYLFAYFFNTGNESGVNVALGLMIISALGLLVMAFVLPLIFVRGKHSLLPAYIIYLVLMSITISTVYLIYDLSIVIYAFGVTSLVFGVMALLGYLFKGSTKGVAVVISGLFIGAAILALINLFLGSSSLDWIISFAILGVVLFVTLFDVTNIKNTIYNGSKNSYNIILYSAITLYMDFINIFLRIIYYLAIIAADKN